MPGKKIFLAALALCWLLPAAAGGFVEDNVRDLFPDLDKWTKDGDPEIFYADNLWEYINGAADMYLLYDFKKVATLTYDAEPKGSITVDIYEHSSLRNAFGVYSRERPRKSDFLAIGAQAYYEKGIVNFFLGSYYVKIMGFYIEDGEKDVLTSVATTVAGRLEGEARFPEVLACFPDENKIKNSETFIAKDFLGRSVLHSAYVAEYDIKGEKKPQVFIIETADENAAKNMLAGYLEKIEAKGNAVVRDKAVCRFEDPYFRSSGKMNVKSGGRYLWGLFSDDPDLADFYFDQIEKNLKTNRLLG